MGYKKGAKPTEKQSSAVKSTRTETAFTKRFAERISLPVVQKTMGGHKEPDYHLVFVRR